MANDAPSWTGVECSEFGWSNGSSPARPSLAKGEANEFRHLPVALELVSALCLVAQSP